MRVRAVVDFSDLLWHRIRIFVDYCTSTSTACSDINISSCRVVVDYAYYLCLGRRATLELKSLKCIAILHIGSKSMGALSWAQVFGSCLRVGDTKAFWSCDSSHEEDQTQKTIDAKFHNNFTKIDKNVFGLKGPDNKIKGTRINDIFRFQTRDPFCRYSTYLR